VRRRRPKMQVESRGYVDDDYLDYSCAIVIDEPDGSWDWVELYLENVDERARGEKRVAKARAIARLWLGDTYFDFPYPEAVSCLEKAKARLLERETGVPPD
jgi:hypothetical protein